MSRRIEETVLVRSDGEGVPTGFVWRDRVYVVREVLGRWNERQDWWAAAGARPLHGDDRRDGEGRGISTAVATLEQEQVVWRVRASRGRTYAEGVYDLTADPMAPVLDDRTGWRLRHVAD